MDNLWKATQVNWKKKTQTKKTVSHPLQMMQVFLLAGSVV